MSVLQEEMEKSHIIQFYIIFIGPLSITLFLYGFFPLVNYDNRIAAQDDIPKFIEDARIKIDTLYQPMVKKLVIMIIDALRWDFITGSIGQIVMPVTSNLIANTSACLLRTKVQPPTVTMPRIKAITTGTIPNFIDIALNFGSKPISGDSVILQAKRAGYKSIFYGDDTWLTLFPSIFERYDGTTSFIVTDFTEVDNNVTRHLNKELYNTSDWSIMILHYLGLDHIGHVHGPSSPLVKSKLKEMDNVIAQIGSMVKEMNQKNDSTLFIICGDHGMKDSGGHGGSTMAETTVPFIAIGGECQQNYKHFTEISQIDIASTLSIILGVPIPFSNIGIAFVDLLYNLSVSKKLFILHYNARQVFTHFEKLVDFETTYAYRKYLEALKLHSAWLNTQGHPNDMTEDIVMSYKMALREMKEALISSAVKYDFAIVSVAIIFLCHIVCIVMGTMSSTPPSMKNIILYFLLNILIFTTVNSFSRYEDISLLHSKNCLTILIVFYIILILTINSYLLASIIDLKFLKIKECVKKIRKELPLVGSFVHAISLAGTSFVEEEHQTWYFYWATTLTFLLYINVTELFSHLRPYQNYQRRSYAHICMKVLSLMLIHRVLRKLNSTGDKYAHLPDIAGYLIEAESKLGMTILVLVGLVLLTWIDFTREPEKRKPQSLLLNSIASTLIYLRHMNDNKVAKIPFYPQSRGIHEVQIFWLLLAMNFTISIYRLTETIKYNRKILFKDTISLILRMWIMIAAMLHQPHNMILLPFQIIVSDTILKIIKNDTKIEIKTFLYMMIGNVFYFYQGNSNSLATIDVAAGYVGMQSYMPFINGSFMIINTYSAPVLAYLLLICHSIIICPHDVYGIVVQCSKIYITCRFLPVTLYTIIISIQRHHLFVWSVFSPKLLYEAIHTTVICFIVFIILILILLHKAINNFE